MPSVETIASIFVKVFKVVSSTFLSKAFPSILHDFLRETMKFVKIFTFKSNQLGVVALITKILRMCL